MNRDNYPALKDEEDLTVNPSRSITRFLCITRRRTRAGYFCRLFLYTTLSATIVFLFTTLLNGHYKLDVDFKDYLPNIISEPASTTSVADESEPLNYSKQAYVTLLTPEDPHPWTQGKPDYYFEAAKILAHRLIRHPTTRDPYN